MIATFVLADFFGNYGEPAVRVGPLAIGQSVTDVRNAIGPGVAAHDCEGRTAAPEAACDLLLRYTDGSAVVIVRIPPHGVVSSISIGFASPITRAQRLSRRMGRVAAWQWRGGPIGAFPPGAVPGWNRASYAPGRDCTADFEVPDISVDLTCAAGTDRLAEFTVSEH